MPQRARLDPMGLLPASFWSAMNAFVNWAEGLGLIGLGILTFTEAIIQPIPPEALTLPMFIAAQGSPHMIFLIWAVATLTSVAGAVVGWWLGKAFGRQLADRFVDEKHLKRLDNLISRYGEAGVFIAALSPIPYKVLAWVAGMGDMDQRRFIYAGLIGRGLRFGIEAVAIGIWGSELLSALESPWVWLVGTVLGILVLIPAKRWWDGLLDEEE
jgi:membrane protein YqaA with SNARE-associated domain